MQSKTILITGASSGIGEACAMALATQGTKLILVARREGRLKAIAETLKESGAQVLTQVLDVRDHDAIESFIKHLPAEFADIDILINNAGCALGVDTVADGPLKDWDDMIDINVKGLLYMTRAFLPSMLKRKHGHIVNIGSTAAHNVYTGGSVYCATKHAVNAITKTMQLEVAGTGVKVTEIDPGAVETEFSVVRFKGDEAKAKKVYENMKAPLNAGDVADAIVYAVTRPAHVNIAQILLYSVHQTEKLPS
jgi:NADP-dependent 3-hydroxy acid dehydrogenase YdfG